MKRKTIGSVFTEEVHLTDFYQKSRLKTYMIVAPPEVALFYYIELEKKGRSRKSKLRFKICLRYSLPQLMIGPKSFQNFMRMEIKIVIVNIDYILSVYRLG